MSQRVFSVKFPAKFQVWGMMSHHALSELHIVPQGQSINAAYYRNEILAKTCIDALNRDPNQDVLRSGPCWKTCPKWYSCKMASPAHTANSTQQWCSEHLKAFWREADWPGNSPDLNPIENLWGILKEKMEERGQINSIDELIKTLKFAWQGISSDILENLVVYMPERIRLVLERNGSHINK